MELQTVHDFIAAINRQDVEGIYALMSDDHVFVDAHGNQMKGKDTMKEGWKGYFGWFPNYTIEVDQAFAQGDTISIFGSAQGNYLNKPEAHFKIPAAWKVMVKKGKIAHWQVYADTSIPFDVVSKFSVKENNQDNQQA